jgi:hypothetical protein
MKRRCGNNDIIGSDSVAVAVGYANVYERALAKWINY